jgi:hypothetical protein
MRYFTAFALLLLSGSIGLAQERIDPRHPDAYEFPEFGRMVGTIDSTKRTGVGIGEQFGFRICPVGDVNHDGLADWLVGHNRIDSIQMHGSIPIAPIEFLLYAGVQGGVPTTESGVRIGPTELFCETDFLAAGDFDADGNPDIVMQAKFWGDTSFNNHGGKPLTYVVVYWGNESGKYSNNDTSRLRGTANTWLGVGCGASGDISQDGVDDLVLYFPEGTAQGNGETVKAPRMHLFTAGHNQRWGRNGVPSNAQLQWWSRYHANTKPELKILDHDRDGLNDIILLDQARNTSSTSTQITTLYNDPNHSILDTLKMERIELAVANGKTTRVMDITGDSAPEMVTSCGPEAVFKLYAGQKGQRIVEQYGTGNDGPLAGKGWWNRPWQTILQPNALHDGWLKVEQMALAELGDGNLDGVDDIWTYSAPFLLCYTTREYPDQWADGYIRIGHLYAGSNIGDIDGSGTNMIALHYDPTPRDPLRPNPGGIILIKPTQSLPTHFIGPPVRLPHPESNVPVGAGDSNDVGLYQIRGSEGDIIGLKRPYPGIEYTIEFTDQLGRVAASHPLNQFNRRITLDLPAGIYFATLLAQGRRVTKAIVVHR